MKKRNESKMTMAALMMLAAMAMTSCASSKKINGNSNAGKSSEMGKMKRIWIIAILFFLTPSRI